MINTEKWTTTIEQRNPRVWSVVRQGIDGARRNVGKIENLGRSIRDGLDCRGWLFAPGGAWLTGSEVRLISEKIDELNGGAQ